MARKKVNLAYITNDSTRKESFNKRKKSLMKKANELSTLCAVDACAIIFGPFDAEPEVFPSRLGFQHVVTRFKTMPELERSKKMVNHESFTEQRLAKVEEQLRKQQKENRHKEMTLVMHQCLVDEKLQYLGMVDFNDLGILLNQNVKDVDSRIELLKKECLSQGMTILNESENERM